MASLASIRKLENYLVTIRVTREFKVRVWLALRLFWLGARVAGCEVKFEFLDKSNPPRSKTGNAALTSSFGPSC